jgi:hypothetical protein
MRRGEPLSLFLLSVSTKIEVYGWSAESSVSTLEKKIGERNCGLQIGAREKTEQGDVWPDLCWIIEDNMQQ